MKLLEVGHVGTDWVGAGNLRRYAVQFKGQLYPGRSLSLSAKVTRKYKEGDENRIDADLTVTDDQGGVLITGKATAALPSFECSPAAWPRHSRPPWL